jgi:ribonuclease HI
MILAKTSDLPLIKLYFDESCESRTTKLGSWACVIKLGDKRVEMTGVEEKTTQNRMALTAMRIGLERIKSKDCRVLMIGDSAYAVNCIKDRWFDNWLTNGWIASAGTPVENPELWLPIINLVNSFAAVYGRHMRGHGKPQKNPDITLEDIIENARCDELCKMAREAYKKEHGWTK